MLFVVVVVAADVDVAIAIATVVTLNRYFYPLTHSTPSVYTRTDC